MSDPEIINFCAWMLIAMTTLGLVYCFSCGDPCECEYAMKPSEASSPPLAIDGAHGD